MLVLALLAPGAAAQGSRPWGIPWAAASEPVAGAAHVLGSTNAGCLAGAERLPPDGPGWQAVRVSRNRHWGHPVLVWAVGGLAARAAVAGLPALWIGDMSQPRGGPMPSGHASHQAGLDVDIWFDLTQKTFSSPAQRENIAETSLVLPGGDAVDPMRWLPAHGRLVRLAAETPGVDRVLVNPAIKRELCRVAGGEGWLRHVRPWWGHDAHLHLRLRCPAGQDNCTDIAPPPAGDGCDQSLEWWFSAESRSPAAGRSLPPRLPTACAAVLSGIYPR